ncbi:MAG: arginine repressor [Clostridiaceae bacterium]|jgi:transcriptional regulator of arginine metabolism|nr:arginine repressor [Clostridiaceae bacterium]
MKPSKSERQAKLLRIIRDSAVGTQEELALRMHEAGMEVTQATISRDIKELGIIKVTTTAGTQKYVPMERSGETTSIRLMKVFSEAVVHVDVAMNLVIMRTLPGMAQAGASALDSMRLPEVAGSIAGDDTIFVAARTSEMAEQLGRLLSQMAHRSEQ